MGFWGKIGKIISITFMGVGAAGVIGFGALTGVAANATISQEFEMGGKKIISYGVGSSNYGQRWVDGKPEGKRENVDIDGKVISYSDFVKKHKETVDGKEFQEGMKQQEEQIKKLKEMLDQMPEGEDKVKLQEQYNKAVDMFNKAKDNAYAPTRAYDQLLAGAVLTGISGLLLIAGIPLFILNNKKG